MKLRHTPVVSQNMMPNAFVLGCVQENACMPIFGNAKRAVEWPNQMILRSSISSEIVFLNSTRAASPTNTTSPTSGLRRSSLMASWPPASATICDAWGCALYLQTPVAASNPSLVNSAKSNMFTWTGSSSVWSVMASFRRREIFEVSTGLSYLSNMTSVVCNDASMSSSLSTMNESLASEWVCTKRLPEEKAPHAANGDLLTQPTLG